MSFAADRILTELHAHPHDKAGFDRQDFELLGDEDRQALAKNFLGMVENGAALAVPLRWLLGERFAATIKERMDNLPPGAPALVYLPCRLFEVTRDAGYLARARAEIARGCAHWGAQTKTVLFAVRQMMYFDPFFLNLARYLILHDPDPAVKEDAMAWLSQEKGYRPAEWRNDPELRRCLRGMLCRDAPTPRALAILDRLHTDTGTLAAAGAVTASRMATR